MLDYFSTILMKYVEAEYYLVCNETERKLFEEEQERKLSEKLMQVEK